MMPHLLVAYSRGHGGGARILLPAPDAHGWIRALVLFKYDVTGLQFCPIFGSTRFRIHGFSLRLMSRLRVLCYMLGSGLSENHVAPTRWIGYLHDLAKR